MRVDEVVPPLEGSTLALSALQLAGGSGTSISYPEHDALLYVGGGVGSLDVAGSSSVLSPGTAGLVLAGEEAMVRADGAGLTAVCATVGPEADRHAPLGPRETVIRIDDAGSENATGARSFQILFGPHNGSTRATLFAGFIPPGKAPWHYHLYDEIVWVPAGPGRLHIGETTQELCPGSAFRLRPRQVHIVENLSATETMTIIGVFTPAGSPSAAYLTPEIAAEYRFAD
ncbi:MAG TPA: cupin domain-containing protein [Gaiellaceae bacterium]|nr:cupin domain-containing protein [Gaiellaceae bacterium]